MFLFFLGLVLIIGSIVFRIVASNEIPKFIRNAVVFLGVIIGLFVLIGSSTKYIDEGGQVIKKFGDSLQDGHLIAAKGERGIQAEIIPGPGWSFGPKNGDSLLWWPWLYEIVDVKLITIPADKVGVVTARDGEPLPEGEIFAPEWKNANEMIDATTFLTKGGCRGPQLTVLPPTTYRYNPALFDIQIADATDIPIGFVGVVRANAGLKLTNEVDMVNGVPLVPRGYRGLWKEPLLPNRYYLHPQAYQVVKVSTTKRMYSYTSPSGPESNTSSKTEPEGDNSIQVRSSDGYTFPVDCRVGVCILANNAPYVVAKIGDPDSERVKDGFDLLEEKCVLPSLRAILRNSAEKKKALEYVNSRTVVESDGKKLFTIDMQLDKIETEGFFLSDIGLNRTPEGQALLKTQTDKELALQQQEQYKEQVRAEDQRAAKVKAETAADQQKNIQASLAEIEVEKNRAEAAKNKAQGEAAQSFVYEAKVKALGGVENFTRLEITKMVVDKMGETVSAKGWPVLPQIMVTGGAGTTGGDGLVASTLAQINQSMKSTTTK